MNFTFPLNPNPGDTYQNGDSPVYIFDGQYWGINYLTPGGSVTTGGTVSMVSLTYSEFYTAITNSTLVEGAYYMINDFETCYDQPDFNEYGDAITGTYKTSGIVEPIIVFALGDNKVTSEAYQPAYPKDKIKYDWTYNQTEETNGSAKGRIIERIDEFNNRTDYDHRNILFKRYRNYIADYNNRYPGTVDILNGAVTGTDTTFTNLSVGDVIYIGDIAEYRITQIDSNTSMTVTGKTDYSANNVMFYAPYMFSYGFKRNNVDDNTIYTEHYTFDFENNTYLNNYIGNFTNVNNWDDNRTNFLANNVFTGSDFINNTFGDFCYNNTFDDDCSNNVIGPNFYNNTTDDDFDNNVITTSFNNNYISANFQHNITGYDFDNNIITCGSFYRNEIGNQFNNNKIPNGDFQNNKIMNGFNNNKTFSAFYKNNIGNGFNGNTINVEFYGNYIGNAYNNNTLNIYNGIGRFSENKILEEFNNNTISGRYYKNQIGNNYQNNQVGDEFAYNVIGDDFANNTIGEYFGFGYSTIRGNRIANQFQSNTIGNHFYDNTICDRFIGNITPQNFQYNDIRYPLTGFNFNSNNNIIVDFTFNTPSGVDNTYNSVIGISNLSGSNSEFTVTVAGGVVTNVTMVSPGFNYQVNETITVPGAVFGNTSGEDLLIIVTAVGPTAMVVGDYNCTILKDPNGQLLLTTVTNIGGLYYMTDITQIFD